MLGYQTGVKGYRLWSIEQGDRKIFISRDVFSEDEMPLMQSSRVSIDPLQEYQLIRGQAIKNLRLVNLR